MSSAMPMTAMSQAAVEPAWKRILLGPDKKMHLGTIMCLLVCTQYLLWFLIIGLVLLPHGLASPQSCYLFMTQQLLACLIFYPLLRSGMTRRWSDPLLVVPQMLWGSAVLVIGYALAEVTRPVLMQTLCLVQVFGFISLKPRQARIMGVVVIAMLLCMLPLAVAFEAPNFLLASEVVKVSATCVVIGFLTIQSENLARLRERVMKDKRELRNLLQEVHRISMHDALTGLLNRQAMQERIESELKRAERTGSSCCVALVDLDHFKQINDGHGHQVGDEVLLSFANAAGSALRETDVVARWGGEEFVVLMPDTRPAPVGIAGLQRVREHLAAMQLSEKAPDLRVTFSAGLTVSQPGETLDQLIERADLALYAAKAQGRDRIVSTP